MNIYEPRKILARLEGLADEMRNLTLSCLGQCGRFFGGQRRRREPRQGGYVLPLVLVMALIALLFGFGRLLLFRQQCQLRLDRQRSIDQIMATRSALRWLECTDFPPLDDTNFVYQARSGDIDVTVKPLPSIYPAPGSNDHLNLEAERVTWEWETLSGIERYTTESAESRTMYPKIIDGDPEGEQPWLLKIGSSGQDSTGHTGRLTIRMQGLGSWLDDLFGRRYWIRPKNVNADVEDGSEGDIMRFGLTPGSSSLTNPSCAAIWIEKVHDKESSAVTAWARDGIDFVTNFPAQALGDVTYGSGLQLSGTSMTLFEWMPGDGFGEYRFSDTHNLPEGLANAFSNTDVTVTLEIEARNSRDPDEGETENSFRWVKVDPAYEYEILLEWDSRKHTGRIQEVATVVHVQPGERVADAEAFTYDAHGTKAD